MPTARASASPVGGSRQFVAIGLNYGKHAAETGAEPPKEPIVFNKAITSIQGPNDDVKLPEGSTQMDWEVELGVIIGATARSVPKDKALTYVAGYCLANDVSERHWQTQRGGQWVKGKSFDTFGPLGPVLVTADEIPDPQKLPVSLKVNGVRFGRTAAPAT